MFGMLDCYIRLRKLMSILETVSAGIVPSRRNDVPQEYLDGEVLDKDMEFSIIQKKSTIIIKYLLSGYLTSFHAMINDASCSKIKASG